MNESSEIELHVFCDVSSLAYDAVAYTLTDNNPHTPSFVMAKSRIVLRYAKGWSIPRIELIAVVEVLHALLYYHWML